MLKLLCVTAHPDDEAGCFGGILSKYSEAGVHCSVICLTAGERAANRGGLVEDEALKAVRRQEFADSCHLLGVAHSEVLDFADGALDREDFAQVAGRLVHILRILRPHVVVTFAADGYLTAHPDHGMAGMFTAAAFQWAARNNRYTAQLKDAPLQDGLTPWQAKKLYCVTAEFSLPERPVVSLAPVTARVSVVAIPPSQARSLCPAQNAASAAKGLRARAAAGRRPRTLPPCRHRRNHPNADGNRPLRRNQGAIEPPP